MAGNLYKINGKIRRVTDAKAEEMKRQGLEVKRIDGPPEDKALSAPAENKTEPEPEEESKPGLLTRLGFGG